MAYIDELLGRGEQILSVARQHVFVLIGHVLMESVVIGLLIAAAVVSNRAFRPGPIVANMPASTFVPLACAILSLFVLISGLLDFLRWNTEQYVVTDRRVIQIRGILSKRVIDSSLSKINDIQLKQSLVGRMFNFGTVEILTASEESANVMDRIAEPLTFKRVMLEAKYNHERGYRYGESRGGTFSPDHLAHGQGDIQHTLAELAALRDRGILSSDEFEAKKRELLNRI
jgi:membrane protein YdbS with pleckstrin-like domain